MTEQLHKRFTDEQVKALFKRYIDREIQVHYMLEILGIKRRRFFELVKKYREDPEGFSIHIARNNKGRKIPEAVERNIIKELDIEKSLIEDRQMPVKSYNYSYIKDQIFDKYRHKVSLPTVIKRAKDSGFYFPKPKKKSHDREVTTNYVGELIQHDSSYHKWSPYAESKWHLITSLDDHSRMLLYADFVDRETSWDHIAALKDVMEIYGVPFSYYVDNHSIFRFVQGRDSFWRKHYKVTDESDSQWKQVLIDCNVKTIYALSPQAKGKIERPYGWLQDRIVRTCARERVETIEQGKEILKHETERYNYRQVHSATLGIPAIRREFKIRHPNPNKPEKLEAESLQPFTA